LKYGGADFLQNPRIFSLQNGPRMRASLLHTNTENLSTNNYSKKNSEIFAHIDVSEFYFAEICILFSLCKIELILGLANMEGRRQSATIYTATTTNFQECLDYALDRTVILFPNLSLDGSRQHSTVHCTVHTKLDRF
jgi:hypothetical protein